MQHLPDLCFLHDDTGDKPQRLPLRLGHLAACETLFDLATADSIFQEPINVTEVSFAAWMAAGRPGAPDEPPPDSRDCPAWFVFQAWMEGLATIASIPHNAADPTDPASAGPSTLAPPDSN